MVKKKTFCEKNFSTMFLRVACISETCCKILSINDLQAQGAPARKPLTIKYLRKLILRQNLNESKRSKVILWQNLNDSKRSKPLTINYLQEPLPRTRNSLIINKI